MGHHAVQLRIDRMHQRLCRHLDIVAAAVAALQVKGRLVADTVLETAELVELHDAGPAIRCSSACKRGPFRVVHHGVENGAHRRVERWSVLP